MTPDALTAVADYLATARWFAGKGRELTVLGATRVGSLGEAGTFPVVGIELVDVEYGGAEPHERETYQVPLAYYDEEQDRIEHALVGTWTDPDLGRVVVYDAVHDREATALYLRAFDAAAGGGESRARRADVPPAARARPGPGDALDAVLRRAEQLLGRLRRGLADEGVPQGQHRPQPRHRHPPRPHRAGQRPRRRPLRLARADRAPTPTPTPTRSSSRCSSSSCGPRATAGTSRWPACATCSPRPTCTPTRSAATSRPRPPGSGWPPRRSTTCWPSSSPPRRGAPTT